MFHWLIIVFGILILSVSLSNPVYKLIIKKHITLNLLSQVLVRIFLFFIGIFIIIIGLYVESIN